jgi:hypothetical protein
MQWWPIHRTASPQATGFDEADCATFLDSPHGRHFADDVLNALHDGHPLPKAIDCAVTRWQGYKLSASSRIQHGIPAGVTYLQGFVGAAAF